MSGSMGEKCAAGKYVGAVLTEMSKSGQQQVLHLWRDSGLDWSEFISSDVTVEGFLADNKLEWTLQAPELSTVAPPRLSMEITRLLDLNK